MIGKKINDNFHNNAALEKRIINELKVNTHL